MLPKNLFPSPSPLFAPLTSPAISTISIEVGVTFFGSISFSKKFNLSSGTIIFPKFGSIVQKGKFAL